MSSSPLRKKRQSVRSPQRRLQSSKSHNDTSFDPFLSTAESDDATILKQTLLAQLNARVVADKSSPFVFGQNTLGEELQSTKRYDGKHDKIFKSMKSIAALHISDNPRLPVSRSQSNRDLFKLEPSFPTSAKRAVSGDHPVATPSKRRKVESIKLSPSSIPKLSFNFDKGQPAQQQTTASMTVAMSKLGTHQTQSSSSRSRIPKSPSRATFTSGGSSNSNSGLSKSVPPPATPDLATSALPRPRETPYTGNREAEQKRQQKRQEQRKKDTMQRMLAKTALPRPGWK